MKKIFIILLLFISLLTLTGCENQYANDFEKNKQFDIKEEVVKEDVYNDIIEAINNYNNQKNKSITFKISYLEGVFGFEGYYKEDSIENHIKIESYTTARLSYVYKEIEKVYVKDGYIYRETIESSITESEKKVEKTKTKYTNNDDISMTFPLINEETILKDEYQYGKDKKGNIIVQDLEGYFRMVIKDKEIIFIGYEYYEGATIYFLIEYGKAEIKYPNFDDYTEE